MPNWVEEQWKQIRGNAKWELIRVVFGGGVLGTTYALIKATTVYWKVQISIFAFSVVGFFVASMLQRARRTDKIAPEIPIATQLGHSFEYSPTATYPLKMRLTFRNDSSCPIDVRIGKFIEDRAPLQLPFVTHVFQLFLNGKWLPDPNGLDKAAVLPGEQFRTWIGFDSIKTSKEKLESAKDKLGVYTLIVNGHTLTFYL